MSKPTHYVYNEIKIDELNQGDVLQRSPDLVALLEDYFPYYAKHRDYVYFMVLTQTCDLVRRGGDTCTAPYISLAAVRPIKDVLLMEAAKHQHAKLKTTNIVGSRGREKLGMFLESLIDNNKAGLFYLHTDTSLDITEPYCAILQLSISLRAEHYDKCLGAKIAQLKEPFQAKLGWLIGNMYSRVATTEWNIESKADKVGKVASGLIKKNIDNYDDEQIRAALTELEEDGRIEAMAVDEIAKHVREKRLVPKLAQFKERAAETLSGLKMIEPVKSSILEAIQRDEILKTEIAGLCAAQEGVDPNASAEQVMRLLSACISGAMSDEPSDERAKFIKGIVTDLMADKVLKNLIKP